MRIQLVNAYLKMMDEGLVPYLKCGTDKDHTRPFVRYLSNEENLEFYCLACSWTRKISIQEYDTMRLVLSLYDIEWLNSD